MTRTASCHGSKISGVARQRRSANGGLARLFECPRHRTTTHASWHLFHQGGVWPCPVCVDHDTSCRHCDGPGVIDRSLLVDWIVALMASTPKGCRSCRCRLTSLHRDVVVTSCVDIAIANLRRRRRLVWLVVASLRLATGDSCCH